MFSAFLEWLFECINGAVSGFAETVLTTVGADLTTLEDTFTVLPDFNNTMKSLGIVFVILIFGSNIIIMMASTITDTTSESPMSLLIRTLVAGFFTKESIEICKILLAVVVDMQQMILNTVAGGPTFPELGLSSLAGGAITVGTGPFFLVAIVLLLIFGYNYLMIVVQLLQRYCYLGIITYTSPLAFSMLASKSTVGFFKSWLNMYFGQALLVLLSTWGVEVIIFTGNNMRSNSGILQYLFMLVMCKAITKFEDILNRIGIKSAPADTGLMGFRTFVSPFMYRAAMSLTNMAFQGKPSWTGRGQTYNRTPNSSVMKNGPAQIRSKFWGTDVTSNTSTKAEYNSKVVKTPEGYRMSKIPVDYSTGLQKPSAKAVVGGITGKNIHGENTSLLQGAGIGVFRNYSDSLEVQQNSQAAINTRIKETFGYNGAIEKINRTMSHSVTDPDNEGIMYGKHLAQGLNLKETNPNIELTGAFAHAGKEDSYMTGIAKIADRSGTTKEELVAVSFNGSNGLPGFFNTTTYQTIGETGVRIYRPMNEYGLKQSKTTDLYASAYAEAMDINEKTYIIEEKNAEIINKKTEAEGEQQATQS